MLRYIITSECAETSGVKGLTLLKSLEDIFSGALNIWMDAVRSFGSLKNSALINSVNVVYREKLLG